MFVIYYGKKPWGSLIQTTVGRKESVFVSKYPATSEGNSVTPKKAKPNELGAGSNSAVSPTVNSPTVTPSQNVSSKGRVDQMV